MGRLLSILRAPATAVLGLAALLPILGRSANEAGASAPVFALTVPAATAAPTSRPPELRTWEELRAGATHLLGRRVRFVVQFQRHLEQWTTYCSRFGPGEFGAFQSWSDEQMPWRVADYETPRVRLFYRKGTPVEEVLGGGETYARFEIEGTLRELFLGEPWIEVEAARALPERLTEGSVIHASRALALLDEGQWTFACTELDMALQARLPSAARAELEHLKQVAELAAGTRSDSGADMR